MTSACFLASQNRKLLIYVKSILNESPWNVNGFFDGFGPGLFARKIKRMPFRSGNDCLEILVRLQLLADKLLGC